MDGPPGNARAHRAWYSLDVEPCGIKHQVAYAALLFLEWWLGKTDRVPANSTVDLVVACLKILTRRKKMEKPIVDAPLGSVGEAKFTIAAGQLVFDVKVGGLGLSADLMLGVDTDKLVDAICAAIPGTVDDQLGSVLKVALKAI